MSEAPMIEVERLTVAFPAAAKPAVNGISFQLARGDVLGLVGESGSGKSLTGLSLIGLTPPSARTSGEVRLFGAPAPAPGHPAWRALRGKRIGCIFQDALVSLNPVRTIGALMREALALDGLHDRREANQRAAAALAAVGVPAPTERLSAYPHQLSGGLRQRAMIALALLRDPDLIIADEPTTALDATIQAQALDLLAEKAQARAMVFITHDLNAAARVCTHIMVIRHGACVEMGPATEILQHPQTAYAQELLAAAPSLTRVYAAAFGAPKLARAAPLLEARALSKTFRTAAGPLRALRGVDLALHRGRTLALVGESGSGKSTLARLLAGLEKADAGEIRSTAPADPAAPRRRLAQMVFQDPYASLDPQWSVRASVAEPLIAQRLEPRRQALASAQRLLAEVGLEAAALRPPGALSGGQRQRAAIARAVAPGPAVLIADEPVSALDVSIQAQIMALLGARQQEGGLAMLLVSHDIALVRHCSHDIAVLYLGRIVEEGPTEAVIAAPRHPYTAALIAAAQGERATAATGEPPSPLQPPGGCAFHTRCPRAAPTCATEAPGLVEAGAARRVACHFPLPIEDAP